MKPLLLTLATLAALALNPTLRAADGWISLFNGKDLSGWKSNDEIPGVFTVENGGLKVSGGRAHLFYVGAEGAAKFKNFELKARVKTTPGSNSGIYFHTEFQEKGWPDKGFECQVNSTHTDPIRTGSLYGMCHVYKQLVKPDTWFTYELEVRDDVWRGRKMTRIKITIDGNELYEYLDFALTFKEGHFAFQQHDPGSKVSIRKVEVLPLADAP